MCWSCYKFGLFSLCHIFVDFLVNLHMIFKRVDSLIIIIIGLIPSQEYSLCLG